MVYKTKGTCSSEIEFEVENGILTDIHFVGGCQGNSAYKGKGRYFAGKE